MLAVESKERRSRKKLREYSAKTGVSLFLVVMTRTLVFTGGGTT